MGLSSELLDALSREPSNWVDLFDAAQHFWGIPFEEAVCLLFVCFRGTSAAAAFSAVATITQVPFGCTMRWSLAYELNRIFDEALEIAAGHQEMRLQSLRSADRTQRSKYEMRVEHRQTTVRLRWKRPTFRRVGDGWSREDVYLTIGETTHRTLRGQYRDAPAWEKKIIEEIEDSFEKLRVQVAKIGKIYEICRHLPDFGGPLTREDAMKA